MTFTLTFDFEDSEMLYHTAMAATIFRDEDQTGRFAILGKDAKDKGLAEMVLAGSEYDTGSILWCDTAASALLLKKIHDAAGHTTLLLVDQAEDEAAVLTSWDLYEGKPALTDALVAAELILYGDGSLPDSLQEQILAVVTSHENTSVMGRPTAEDHEDHFHFSLIVNAPGTELKVIAHALTEIHDGPVGFEVISTEVDDLS